MFARLLCLVVLFTLVTPVSAESVGDLVGLRHASGQDPVGQWIACTLQYVNELIATTNGFMADTVVPFVNWVVAYLIVHAMTSMSVIEPLIAYLQVVVNALSIFISEVMAGNPGPAASAFLLTVYGSTAAYAMNWYDALTGAAARVVQDVMTHAVDLGYDTVGAASAAVGASASYVGCVLP